MIEIIVPHVGETSSSVYIQKWHKRVGDRVRRGDVLVDVETDKTVVDVQAFADGVLAEILVDEGEEAQALEPIGMIREE